MFSKILGEAKGIFNIITILDLAISIIFIIFGLTFFNNSASSNFFVSLVTGFILIGNGCASIFAYKKRDGIDLYNNNFLFGIVYILCGLIAIFSGRILSIILGIYILITGLQKINYGLFLKKFSESSWFITVVTGILLIVIAIITLFTNSEFAIKVTGICLLGFGLINLINTLLLRKRSKYFIA